MIDRNKMTDEELQKEFEIATEYNRYVDMTELMEKTFLPFPSKKIDERLNEYALEKSKDPFLDQRTDQIANAFIRKIWLRDLTDLSGLFDLLKHFTRCSVAWQKENTDYIPIRYENGCLYLEEKDAGFVPVRDESGCLYLKEDIKTIPVKELLQLLPETDGPLRIKANGRKMTICDLRFRPREKVIYLYLE